MKVHPYTTPPTLAPAVSATPVPLNYEHGVTRYTQIQSFMALVLYVSKLVFIVANTVYCFTKTGLAGAQVPYKSVIPDLSFSTEESFYFVSHSKNVFIDSLQPVDSPTSSFFPAVQSGQCSATCAHMLSEKLLNTIQKGAVPSQSAYFVGPAPGNVAYTFNPEPLYTTAYTESKCRIKGSTISNIYLSCSGAILGYPEFTSGVALWAVYFAVFVTQKMIPLVAFKFNFDDLRLRLAIDSLPYSKSSKVLLYMGYGLTLASFVLAMQVNSKFQTSNELLVSTAFWFVITNSVALASFGQSEFDIVITVSEIKTKWPHKVQCSSPRNPDVHFIAYAWGLVSSQESYFGQLLRNLHACNQHRLQGWGKPQEIIDFVTQVLSKEGSKEGLADVPHDSKPIPLPLICKLSIFCITLVVGYQSFLQVKEASLSSNTRTFPFDDTVQSVGVSIFGDGELSSTVSSMTALLPSALPGETASSILQRDTVSFYGLRASCEETIGTPSSPTLFQMSAGICKPISDGRSFSYAASSQSQNNPQTVLGTLNVYNGKTCTGAISRAIPIRLFDCDDNPLNQVIPFDEPSSNHAEKRDIRKVIEPFKSFVVFSIDSAVPFTNANVGVTIGSRVFNGESIDLGVTRYRVDPMVAISLSAIAGEQRIAACMQSEKSCFPAVSDLFQKKRPKRNIIDLSYNTASCAPRPPYNGLEHEDMLAVLTSSKYTSYVVPTSSFTMACTSNTPELMLPLVSSLWALFLAIVVLPLFWKSRSYSPSDFRFFIALEVGTQLNKSRHLQSIGMLLAVITFLLSAIYAVSDGYIRALLYLFSTTTAINAMFKTAQSSHASTVQSSTVQLEGAATNPSTEANTNKVEAILNATSSPISFILPKSRISITELNGILIKTEPVFKKIEKLMLKDALCKTDTLKTWGDGTAISQIMQSIVNEN
jgi:hypothetical protein